MFICLYPKRRFKCRAWQPDAGRIFDVLQFILCVVFTFVWIQKQWKLYYKIKNTNAKHTNKHQYTNKTSTIQKYSSQIKKILNTTIQSKHTSKIQNSVQKCKNKRIQKLQKSQIQDKIQTIYKFKSSVQKIQQFSNYKYKNPKILKHIKIQHIQNPVQK